MSEYVFLVHAVEDGECAFSRRYHSALDAVRAYELFKDSGDAKYRREVVLVEPNGKTHSKVFDVPRLLAIR